MSHFSTARAPRSRCNHQRPPPAISRASHNDWNAKVVLGEKLDSSGGNDETRYPYGSSTSSDSSLDKSMFQTQEGTPYTTPSSAPSKNEIVKFIPPEIGTAATHLSDPILNLAEERPVSESLTIIKTTFVGPFTIEQHIESLVDSCGFRRSLNDISLNRSNRAPIELYTARGHFIQAGMTRYKRVQAIHCIDVGVWEDGKFVAYRKSLDTASPYTILYKKKCKDSQRVLDTVDYRDGFSVGIVATNEHRLKFPLHPDCVSSTPFLMEVAETGTQDTAVFTKNGSECPHGTLGLAPAHKTPYAYPVKNIQTILKRWWSQNFARMRGEPKELFGFITLHLRKNRGFVSFGNPLEPTETVSWIKTKETEHWEPNSWSLVVNMSMAIPTTRRPPLFWPESSILFDCGQSLCSMPLDFVDKIYKFLEIEYRVVKRMSEMSSGELQVCYIDARGSIPDEVQITLADNVKLTFPSRFWNEGQREFFEDGSEWRFGPLQIDEAGITFGANAWELMDVHLKSNFEDDQHYIGLTQHLDDLTETTAYGNGIGIVV